VALALGLRWVDEKRHAREEAIAAEAEARRAEASTDDDEDGEFVAEPSSSFPADKPRVAVGEEEEEEEEEASVSSDAAANAPQATGLFQGTNFIFDERPQPDTQSS